MYLRYYFLFYSLFVLQEAEVLLCIYNFLSFRRLRYYFAFYLFLVVQEDFLYIVCSIRVSLFSKVVIILFESTRVASASGVIKVCGKQEVKCV